ncbi:MAG: ATP-binding cassette domain-containing protein, partial [Actinomycetota bacterium]
MIKTVDLKKVYKGGTLAIEGVSMFIEKGEFVFVVGPSGSGKSTFIKMLNKEEEPTDGSIYV